MSFFNKLLIVATVLGLLLPSLGITLSPFALLPLSLSMLFSLLASNQRVKLNLSGVKNGLIYSYLFLTGSLLLASLFMPPGMKEGLIMYAIFPPAVGVLVLGMQWGGNTSQVFFFQLLSYSLSVVVIPIAAYLLLGGSVDATTLLIQLILAFILPGVLSFFMDMKDKKLMANLSSVFLAILFYIVIAKSQPWIVANWAELVIYMIPLATLNAAVGYTAYKLTKSPDATLYSLLKNGGAAAAVSLNVFPPAAIAMISAKTLIDVGLILGFGQLWKNSRPVYID